MRYSKVAVCRGEVLFPRGFCKGVKLIHLTEMGLNRIRKPGDPEDLSKEAFSGFLEVLLEHKHFSSFGL